MNYKSQKVLFQKIYGKGIHTLSDFGIGRKKRERPSQIKTDIFYIETWAKEPMGISIEIERSDDTPNINEWY